MYVNPADRSVALLKINVERGELGVLRSVLALSDWQRIEQVGRGRVLEIQGQLCCRGLG